MTSGEIFSYVMPLV